MKKKKALQQKKNNKRAVKKLIKLLTSDFDGAKVTVKLTYVEENGE